MRPYPHLLSLLVFGLSAAAAQGRIDRTIDNDWRFARENAAGAEAVTFSDSLWERISLPHTWNARDGQDGGNDYYRGVGWYRKRLALDPAYKGKSVFLRFEGAATVSSVFVNGKLAGTHKGGFGAFCFDISPLARFDVPNVVAVRVSNARDTTVAPLRGDFTVFGGIYRSVHLLVLDPLSVSPLDYASSGVYARQSRVSSESADLEVTSVVRNGTAEAKHAVVRCSLLDAEGSVVQKAEAAQPLAASSVKPVVQRLSLTSPRLWNGLGDPYLYRVAVEVLDGARVTDRVVEPVGLRFFSVDPERGFLLNGTPYRLHGVNRHQDRENKGWAIGLEDHQEDYRLIQEMGCTAVRLAHYQQAAAFYDLCDRGGMVVWAELALVDEIHPAPEFAALCREQLTEMIKQNFNHPSIIVWSIFNELMPEANRELYARVVTELNGLAKELDPTRPTAMASRSRYSADEYINTVSDLFAYNVYRGWYEGKPEDFAAFADSYHQRFPLRPLAISEYGAGGSMRQHEVPPAKPPTRGPWHPEEWQATVHEVTWLAMSERPFLWGTFVWNMFDFASDGRSEGDAPGRNDKGLVTYDRKGKKDAFYWYKSSWSAEPVVHITSRRFTPRPPGPTDVKVYANCDSVSLYLNGRPLGTKPCDGKPVVWGNVSLGPGQNAVRAVGVRRGMAVADSCVWQAAAAIPGGR